MGYQVSEQDRHLKPGPQMPSKYPQVGPNYNYYGEMPGFIYNPFTDRYRPDPKAVNQWAQQTGQLPEEQSIMDTLLPIGGAALALSGGKELGKQLPGLFELGSSPTKAVAETAGALASSGGEASSIAGGLMPGVGGIPANLGASPITGLSASGVGSNIASMGGLSSVAVPGAVIAGTLLAGKAGYDMLKGRDANPIGRGLLGIATGGISEIAKATGLLGRKSTKDYQDERWGALSESAQGLRQANHPEGDDGIWDTGKYAGQKWTFEKAKDLAKDDPTHFIGVLGNLETFGDSWLSTPLDKQKAVVAELVRQGLYKSDKGDVLISDRDKAKAKAIYDSIVNGKPMPEEPSQVNSKSGLLGLGLNSPAQQQAILNSPVVTQVSAPSSNPVGLFGFSFEPNSKEYNALTKEQKNAYWTARNG